MQMAEHRSGVKLVSTVPLKYLLQVPVLIFYPGVL